MTFSLEVVLLPPQFYYFSLGKVELACQIADDPSTFFMLGDRILIWLMPILFFREFVNYFIL